MEHKELLKKHGAEACRYLVENGGAKSNPHIMAKYTDIALEGVLQLLDRIETLEVRVKQLDGKEANKEQSESTKVQGNYVGESVQPK